jgi:hypothetical protein
VHERITWSELLNWDFSYILDREEAETTTASEQSASVENKEME